MACRKSRLVFLGTVALAVSLTVGLSVGSAAEVAKLKKKGSNRARTFQNPLASAIPDRESGATGFFGVLNSTIAVGKALKGRRVADLDVSFRANHPDLEDIDVFLIAPNGATVFLAGDNSGTGGDATDYGTGANSCAGTPTTFSDESANFLSNSAASVPVQPGEILSPWAATMEPEGFALNHLDGIKARGVWTLQVLDDAAGDTGTLGCWRLRIKPRKLRR